MGCSGWYLGYGSYWHWGNFAVTVLILTLIVWVIYRLTSNNLYRKTAGGSFSANNFVDINKRSVENKSELKSQ